MREKEVAELIKEARSFGDLSENSEYDEAKNEPVSYTHLPRRTNSCRRPFRPWRSEGPVRPAGRGLFPGGKPGEP